ISGHYLPAKIDPLRRVRGWQPVVDAAEAARVDLKKRTEKDVFLIGGHYGVTGVMSFYLPEAREAVSSAQPLVYFQHTGHLDNQFSFWPSYTNRVGQSAIWVRRVKSPMAPPLKMLEQFEAVVDLGITTNYYRGRPFHLIQLFECLRLRDPAEFGRDLEVEK
ncbi:hypothetical protein N9059_01805, partial [bacterium]|nr:hypothetical protein [bacterium]